MAEVGRSGGRGGCVSWCRRGHDSRRRAQAHTKFLEHFPAVGKTPWLHPLPPRLPVVVRVAVQDAGGGGGEEQHVDAAGQRAGAHPAPHAQRQRKRLGRLRGGGGGNNLVRAGVSVEPSRLAGSAQRCMSACCWQLPSITVSLRFLCTPPPALAHPRHDVQGKLHPAAALLHQGRQPCYPGAGGNEAAGGAPRHVEGRARAAPGERAVEGEEEGGAQHAHPDLAARSRGDGSRSGAALRDEVEPMCSWQCDAPPPTLPASPPQLRRAVGLQQALAVHQDGGDDVHWGVKGRSEGGGGYTEHNAPRQALSSGISEAQ